MTDLIEKLPDELRNCPEAQLLRSVGDHKVYNIVHMIYRARNYEGHSKDYDFSRTSMEEHWRAGSRDVIRTLRHPEALRAAQRPTEGVLTLRPLPRRPGIKEDRGVVKSATSVLRTSAVARDSVFVDFVSLLISGNTAIVDVPLSTA